MRPRFVYLAKKCLCVQQGQEELDIRRGDGFPITLLFKFPGLFVPKRPSMLNRDSRKAFRSLGTLCLVPGGSLAESRPLFRVIQ